MTSQLFWDAPGGGNQWSLGTYNSLAYYAAQGVRIVVCVKPTFTDGLPAGSNFFTTHGTTGQKAAAVADLANLGTFLALPGPRSASTRRTATS